MRGFRAALAFHIANDPLDEYRQYKYQRKNAYKRNHVLVSGLKYRTRRSEPPFAVIEKAILLRLLQLSPNAMRAYCCLCRFANKRTGFAYPSSRKLMHRLGFVPYHTNFRSGRTRVGLTKKQRLTRNAQIDRFTSTFNATIDELLAARLIERGTITAKHVGGKVTHLDGYYILNIHGLHRRLHNLKYRNATFVIEGWMFDTGVFAIRTPSKRNGFEPLLDFCMPLLLLALRDNNLLRFGGIDPSKLELVDGELFIPIAGWPSETCYSMSQMREAIVEMRRRGLINVHSGIFSETYGQLITSSNRPVIEGSDEVRKVAFRFC